MVTGLMCWLGMHHFFSMHISAYWRTYMRYSWVYNLLLAHFPAPAWPSLVLTQCVDCNDGWSADVSTHKWLQIFTNFLVLLSNTPGVHLVTTIFTEVLWNLWIIKVAALQHLIPLENCNIITCYSQDCWLLAATVDHLWQRAGVRVNKPLPCYHRPLHELWQCPPRLRPTPPSSPAVSSLGSPSSPIWWT